LKRVKANRMSCACDVALSFSALLRELFHFLQRMTWCQPRGHCASVDDHGAGSECSVLICCSHNSHSLFSHSVDLVLVDHGHMRLGCEHPRFCCACHSQFYTAHALQKRCRIFSAVTALSWSFLYILQESLLLTNLLVIVE